MKNEYNTHIAIGSNLFIQHQLVGSVGGHAPKKVTPSELLVESWDMGPVPISQKNWE